MNFFHGVFTRFVLASDTLSIVFRLLTSEKGCIIFT